VKIIGTLYAIEERARLQKLDPHARGELRRRESVPILATLQEKLFAWRDQLLPKHPMAQAVAYTLNQWNELTVFAGGAHAITRPRKVVTPNDAHVCGTRDAASEPSPRRNPRPEDFGAVPIDNNTSEREMKRIVLNRKNSLFVGNERAGQTAAILSSLASTCRRHDLDPQRYLTQLLLNLPATPASQIDQWLPNQFKRRDPHPPT
jgi:transposase